MDNSCANPWDEIPENEYMFWDDYNKDSISSTNMDMISRLIDQECEKLNNLLSFNQHTEADLNVEFSNLKNYMKDFGSSSELVYTRADSAEECTANDRQDKVIPCSPSSSPQKKSHSCEIMYSPMVVLLPGSTLDYDYVSIMH